MTQRGDKINWVPLVEGLAKMTVEDFKSDAPSSRFDELMKGISTYCKALVSYTPETGTFARKHYCCPC